MNDREERGHPRVEAPMKPLSLLLVSLTGLTGLTACASSKTAAPPAVQSAEERAFSVIPLQFAAADEVAHTIGSLWPDARALADGRTNSVVVSCASEAELGKVRECIAKLDVQVKAK